MDNPPPPPALDPRNGHKSQERGQDPLEPHRPKNKDPPRFQATAPSPPDTPIRPPLRYTSPSTENAEMVIEK